MLFLHQFFPMYLLFRAETNIMCGPDNCLCVCLMFWAAVIWAPKRLSSQHKLTCLRLWLRLTGTKEGDAMIWHGSSSIWKINVLCSLCQIRSSGSLLALNILHYIYRKNVLNWIWGRLFFMLRSFMDSFLRCKMFRILKPDAEDGNVSNVVDNDIRWWN